MMSFKIVPGVRLDVPIWCPHHCEHFHVEIDKMGIHPWPQLCKSAGNYYHHAAINSI